MRITGPRIWGRDPVPENGRGMDARIACASKPSRAVIGSGSSKSDYGSCTASTPNVPRDEQFAAIKSSSEHKADMLSVSIDVR
jgi:hypothetical protein